MQKLKTWQIHSWPEPWHVKEPCGSWSYRVNRAANIPWTLNHQLFFMTNICHTKATPLIRSIEEIFSSSSYICFIYLLKNLKYPIPPLLHGVTFRVVFRHPKLGNMVGSILPRFVLHPEMVDYNFAQNEDGIIPSILSVIKGVWNQVMMHSCRE